MPIFLFIMLSVYSLLARATVDYDRMQIENRIKPVGQVNVQQETKDNAVSTAKSSEPVPVKVVPGQAIYEQYCVVCHGAGVAGAPKFRDKTDWAPRMAKQNIDELTAIAIKGLNIMPPKGTCAECSEKDIKEAIQYMVPHS